MKKEMLINVLQPEECRIAILEDGVLEELYVERTSHESYVGNIYKGRIVNIEPSIQAAFVDFGVGRNGFLHVSDVEPAYYRHLEQRGGDRGDRGDRNAGNRRPQGRDRDRTGDRGSRERRPDRGPREDRPRHERQPAGEANNETNLTPVQEGPETPPLDAPSAAPPIEEAVAFQDVPVGELYSAEEAKPAAPVDAPVQDAGTPLVALPETMPEEEPGKGRRRSRGGSRRKRAPDAEPTAEAPPADERESTPTPEAAAEPSDEPGTKPKFMDSAERRTTDRDADYSGSGASKDDEDLLFFPRRQPAQKAAPRQETPPPPPPAPVEAVAMPEEEAAVIAEPPPAPPEPAVPFTPPRRPRPAESFRGGSIEDDLEADLAAAESAEDTTAPEFSDDFDDGYEPDADNETDAESAPARQPPSDRGDRGERRDRAPDRGGDRGPRRDDRRGGPRRDDRRDDRRGPRRTGGGGGARPGFGRPKPLIQDIFKRGQEVLVQVIKEGIGTKGPTLSTYISIPGRYLVLMPGLNRTGVSRKIIDEEHRRRLKEIFNELKPPRGLGFIMRTAAIDKNKKDIQRDLAYLSRLWQVIVRRIQKVKGPSEIYQESDMITRTIRDTFTNDINTIWVDEPTAFEHAQEFLSVVMPHYANRIKLFEGKEPLFHKHGIEDEINRIQLRKIPLPFGGSIVIEQTEALVAIDVNSGNFRADNNAEETAYQMNLQAAKEIARQLRLRDLGGVIVNDFIDMRDEKHRRNVEKAMHDAMRRDRARTKILKISQFGLIEMTRQRIRPSLKRSVYQDCAYCKGMAQVKTSESMSIEVMRMLQLVAHREDVQRIEIRVTDEVANYLLNKKRREVSKLEESGNIQVQIVGSPGKPPEMLEFVCYDKNNNEVKVLPVEESPPPRRGR